MLRVTETAVLNHPPDVVFAAAADPYRQLKWDADTLKSIEQVTPTPLGQGSRYRGKFKGFGTVDYEYSEFDQPRRFAHLSRLPVGEMRHIFTFQPEDGGTRVTQEGVLEPSLLGRVMSPLIRSMFNKRFRTIAAELDRYLARPSNA